MKKRNPIAVLFLSYITLGVYVIYWLYITRKEITERLGNPQAIPPVWTMFAPLGGFILIALLMLIMNSADGTGTAIVNIASALLGIVLMVGLFYFVFRFMWRYCKAVYDLTHGTDGSTLFWIWVVGDLFGLGPIAMLMAQNDLNRYIRDHGSVSQPSTGSVDPATPLYSSQHPAEHPVNRAPQDPTQQDR